ncbi:MAG: hypothetical protein KAI66_19745, partial [Lentisphaeria bacterium]|nr:hypothetical protein [Lentisphaeria bacterium]
GNTWTELARQPARQSPGTADYPATTLRTPANAPPFDAVRVRFAALADKQRLIIPEIELWGRGE